MYHMNVKHEFHLIFANSLPTSSLFFHYKDQTVYAGGENKHRFSLILRRCQ